MSEPAATWRHIADDLALALECLLDSPRRHGWLEVRNEDVRAAEQALEARLALAAAEVEP